MATNSYVSQGEELLQAVIKVGEAVRSKSSEAGLIAILVAVTEEVKKIVDPTSAIGRILIATTLEDAAWKLGNSHSAFHKMREAASKLNPAK